MLKFNPVIGVDVGEGVIVAVGESVLVGVRVIVGVRVGFPLSRVGNGETGPIGAPA